VKDGLGGLKKLS
jgi:hypothetical protein